MDEETRKAAIIAMFEKLAEQGGFVYAEAPLEPDDEITLDGGFTLGEALDAAMNKVLERYDLTRKTNAR